MAVHAGVTVHFCSSSVKLFIELALSFAFLGMFALLSALLVEL
jgi:hypothetical protein